MIDNIQINRIARNPNGAQWPGWREHTYQSIHHLVHDRPQTPPVHRFIVRLLPQHFWSQVLKHNNTNHSITPNKYYASIISKSKNPSTGIRSLKFDMFQDSHLYR